MKSPFKFLDSYSKADKNIFFGRDREIEELYQKVFESKVLLLYGVSGTGKSSLIDCGLGNKIADSDWLPVNVRRANGMLNSLFTHLNSVADGLGEGERGRWGDGESVTPKQIVKLIKSVYLDHFKPIYLIFDQFEELFIFGSKEEREEFIEVVKAIMDADVQCKMLFSIREEYLANITEFERKVPEMMKNRMRVEKMSRNNAKEVISGPCKVHGIELEEGFEEALMSKLVPEGNEVELTYLQVYLDKVFRQAGGENSEESLKFTLSQLEKLGNVGDLLGSFLEDQITALDDPESGLAILKSFVSVKGTKRQIHHEEVLESCKTLGTILDDTLLKELINKFVDLRILREKDENGRYELRHDSLAAKIFEKITLVEKEVMEVRLFIENAYNSYLAWKVLLTEDDLTYIEPYEERLFLTKELNGFLENCKYNLDAAKRSFRRVLSISVIGFILLVAAGVLYYMQRSEDSMQDEYVIRAMMQMDYSPELGLMTSLEAYNQDKTKSYSRKLLLDAFYTKLEGDTSAARAVFNFTPLEYPLVSIQLSPDGQNIIGWLKNNEIKCWDLSGNEIWSEKIERCPISVLRISDDMDHIGALLSDSTIIIKQIEQATSYKVHTTPNGINDKYLFDFSGRNDVLAAIVNGNNIVLLNRNGDEIQVLDYSEGQINAIDISPDDRFLAAACSDGKILIWYYNSVTKRFDLYNTQTKSRQGAVRSCQFNMGSNYILAASDDSTTVIRDLNGRIIPTGHFKIFTGYYGFNNLMTKGIYGLGCDAYFMSNDRMVVGEVRHIGVSEEAVKSKGNLYIMHDASSDFVDTRINERLILFDSIINIAYDKPVRYDFLVPSPDTRTVATVVEGQLEIQVVASDHIPILKFPGTNPVYTQDSKYIFSIRDSMIEKHVIDPEEVIDLVWGRKIFSTLEYRSRDWISY